MCAGAALGGMKLARFHSILLPLGSIMSLTKTRTACGIFTPGKKNYKRKVSIFFSFPLVTRRNPAEKPDEPRYKGEFNPEHLE